MRGRQAGAVGSGARRGAEGGNVLASPEGRAWGLPRVGPGSPQSSAARLRAASGRGLSRVGAPSGWGEGFPRFSPAPRGRSGASPPPPRTPGFLPTYAGRHIDEVEQGGRQREEEECGEQRAARQPQQPPADAHSAAEPAPAAPRPPPPGLPPPPGPRPPPPGPRGPPLAAAASPLPAAGRRGPGHIERAGA